MDASDRRFRFVLVALLALVAGLLAAPAASANTPARFPQAGLVDLERMNNLLDKAISRLAPGQPDPNRGDIRVLDDLARKVEKRKRELVFSRFDGQKVRCLDVAAVFSRLERADLAFADATHGTADDAVGNLAVARQKLLTLSALLALAPDQDPTCPRAGNEAAAGAFDKLAKEVGQASDKVEAVVKKLGKDASMTQQPDLVKRIRGLGGEKGKLIRTHMREETYCVRFDALYGNLFLIDKLLGDARSELKKRNPDLDDVRKGFKGARSVKEFVEKVFKQPCPPAGGGECTSTLERSPGVGSFTAHNHIRVRATCNRKIVRVVVESISLDSFDACAQTAGQDIGCSPSGDTLDTSWNQPANEQLEFYGRVTGNADGVYNVKIYGESDVLLREYDATIP
jgi:hypothetical protein